MPYNLSRILHRDGLKQKTSFQLLSFQKKLICPYMPYNLSRILHRDGLKEKPSFSTPNS
jgi:hypothetical protein